MFLAIVIFIFGLIMGSFLNMLIYRLPLEVSLINPSRSICPKCNKIIKWYENIPVLSYVYLKAKCSNCKEKISIIYPIVELFTAFISVLLYLKLSLSYEFLLVLSLFYVLILLSFIDFAYKAVPDYLLLLALVISVFIADVTLVNMLIFAGGFSLLNFVITYYIQNIKAWITKNDELREQTALGEGDIPIVAIIGGVLGLKLGLIAIFFAAIFAIIPAIYNKIKNDDIETAFIPFLVLGFFFVYLFDVSQFLEGLL